MFTFTFNLHLQPSPSTFTFNLHLTLSGVGFANRAEPTRTWSTKMMQTKRNALFIQDAGIIANAKGCQNESRDTYVKSNDNWFREKNGFRENQLKRRFALVQNR